MIQRNKQLLHFVLQIVSKLSFEFGAMKNQMVENPLWMYTSFDWGYNFPSIWAINTLNETNSIDFDSKVHVTAAVDSEFTSLGSFCVNSTAKSLMSALHWHF